MLVGIIPPDRRLGRLGLRPEQARMGEIGRDHVVARHDHARPEPGDLPKPEGEIMGQADAAMRGRIARQRAFMQRDARPGDAFHEGHGRIAIEIGMVEAVLLDDAEHARRGRAARHAGRNRALGDPSPIAVERDVLIGDRDHDLERALRRGGQVFCRLGLESGLRAGLGSGFQLGLVGRTSGRDLMMGIGSFVGIGVGVRIVIRTEPGHRGGGRQARQQPAGHQGERDARQQRPAQGGCRVSEPSR